MLRAILTGAALLALVAHASANPAPAGAAAAQGPQEMMTALSSQLFVALARDHAAIERNPGRVREILRQLLSPHYDVEYTARLVLGANWPHATPEQRQRFAAGLFDTLLETYAGSVSEWTPQRFRILPSQEDPSALRVTVRTQVTRPNGAVVAVDYRLHQTPAGWLVFDVIVDGTSYVRTYHDDTDTEVTQKGLDSVIERLEQRSTARAHAQRSPAP